MLVVTGDLIEMAKQGRFDVIVHGCNCHCAMGKGIAARIKAEFPAAYRADCETKKGDRSKLGTISRAHVISPNAMFTVVNAYTQFNYGRGINVDYSALRKCMKEVKARYSGRKIAYPRIGAGLGGGDWAVIETIINQELDNEDHTLVILG